MNKIRRETVAERTTANLRQAILSSGLPQGTPIVEDAVANDLGVSRTTVRQALNTLLLEGLLTRHPATRVLEVTTLSADEVRDIYRARRFLELGGIDAAGDASPQLLEHLEVAVEELRRVAGSEDPEAFVQADFRCHAAIVGFLGSRHLSDMHRLLMSKLRIVLAQITSDKQDNLDSLAVHEAFCRQILTGRLEEAKEHLARRMAASESIVLGRIASDHR